MSNKELSPEEILEIERQLSCPDGAFGITVAENMNIFNIQMTKAAIKALKLEDAQSILEIGHGNCGHLPYLLEQANSLHYDGLEMSPTMHSEAKRISAEIIVKGIINHTLYDGQTIPFLDHNFDRIFTVNTVYFWKNPTVFINEIYRVLKANGIFVIAFGLEEYMKNLPFVQKRFTLYSKNKMSELISNSNFKKFKIENKTDSYTNHVGETIHRKFALAIMIK